MRRRWIILGALYLCSLSFAFTFQSIPPILTLVMNELNLSHAEGGLLMSFFALPGIFISIPAGMLADRYSHKTLGVISLLLIIAGTAIFAAGTSLPALAVGRVISGLGAMTLTVLNPQMLVTWFAGYEIGTAIGIYTTAMPLGTIISLNTISLLAGNIGWRASLWITIGVFLVTLIVFSILYATAPNQNRHVASENVRHGIRDAGLPVWLAGLIWLLFNAALISFFTFTPDFLTTSGFTIASASFLTSLAMLPAFVTSPAIGYIIDKIDYKRATIGVCTVGAAIILVLIPRALEQMVLLTVLLGVTSNLMVTPLYALVSELSGPRRLGLGYGILATCLNLGVLIGPALAGLAKDITGSYQASYILMAVFVLAIVPVVISIKKPTT